MLNKHAAELRRMRDPEHRSLIPLVETSLAVMRLSCESFFSLAAVRGVWDSYLGPVVLLAPQSLT